MKVIVRAFRAVCSCGFVAPRAGTEGHALDLFRDHERTAHRPGDPAEQYIGWLGRDVTLAGSSHVPRHSDEENRPEIEYPAGMSLEQFNALQVTGLTVVAGP